MPEQVCTATVSTLVASAVVLDSFGARPGLRQLGSAQLKPPLQVSKTPAIWNSIYAACTPVLEPLEPQICSLLSLHWVSLEKPCTPSPHRALHQFATQVLTWTSRTGSLRPAAESTRVLRWGQQWEPCQSTAGFSVSACAVVVGGGAGDPARPSAIGCEPPSTRRVCRLPLTPFKH